MTTTCTATCAINTCGDAGAPRPRTGPGHRQKMICVLASTVTGERIRTLSDKMDCPACHAYTSDVLRAYHDGEPCPYCGLPAEAAGHILRIQRSRADETLKAELIQARTDLGKVQAECDRLARKLERFMAVANDDDWIPDR